MARPVANDGIGWRWFDDLMLWLLPAFLCYVGFKVGGGGIESGVLGCVGLVSGIAAERGIQAAINGHQGQGPSAGE